MKKNNTFNHWNNHSDKIMVVLMFILTGALLGVLFAFADWASQYIN